MFTVRNNVEKIYTYDLDNGYILEVTKEITTSGEETWNGYIYTEYSGFKMFVFGELVSQPCESRKITLKRFLDDVEFYLFDEDYNTFENPFSEYERKVEAIEESNMKYLDEIGVLR